MAKIHTGKEVKKAVFNKIKPRISGSKELNGRIELDGIYVARVTLPKSDDELKRGTESSIRSQLKLNPIQFDKLITCPLHGEDYYEILKIKRSKGLL